MTDTYYLDYDDIKRVTPGDKLPYGYQELIPGSGVGIPDLSVNQLHPGFWKPNVMPPHPVDLSTIITAPPGKLPPYGYTELVPGRGVFIDNPYGHAGVPGKTPTIAKTPLDLAAIRPPGPGGLFPYGYKELIPGSGIGVPDPAVSSGLADAAQGALLGGILGKPSGFHRDDTNGHDGEKGLPNKIFEVDNRQLLDFAQQHDLNANEIRQWAQGNDPDFPERFLATHGNVAYPTYLRIKEFMKDRQVQAEAYAERHASTATALRTAVGTITTVDGESAAAFAPPTTSV